MNSSIHYDRSAAEAIGSTTHQVSANVSQYVILHDTNVTLSGSHTPLDPSVSVPGIDARSIGTSNTILAGSAMARKTGTRR
jgi:hypothetical protein